jgi:hypothetical protein
MAASLNVRIINSLSFTIMANYFALKIVWMSLRSLILLFISFILPILINITILFMSNHEYYVTGIKFALSTDSSFSVIIEDFNVSR